MFTHYSILENLAALILGLVLDLIFGDPRWLYHPVRIIGNGISCMEKVIHRLLKSCSDVKRPLYQLFAGGILAVFIVFMTTGITVFFIYIAAKLSITFAFCLKVFMSYQILAMRSLKDESMKVYYALREEGVQPARQAVSMIVGRDTSQLDEEQIMRAAVETIAENTSDGVIAPLFYMALGGPAAGFFYKAVNTLDSMIGYRNEKYLYLGKVSAKLDDALNYIPARLSAVSMVLAAWVLKLNTKNAWYIFKRDRYNHASPNSAQTEAVMAGALGIELAGDARYFGVLYRKKTIGDKLRAIEAEDIKRANKLLYTSSLLFAGLLVLSMAVLAAVL